MLKQFLEDNHISALFDESMANHTTFKVGGKAMCVASPDTAEKAAKLIAYLKSENIKSYYLGNGSNVIFADEGFDGVVIKSSMLNKTSVNENDFTAMSQAGVSMTALAWQLAGAGLSGMEFAYGIPGNVGGGVYMNAGAYGGQMSDCVYKVEYIDRDGNFAAVDFAGCDFDYRHSAFMDNKWFITNVYFKLKPGNKEEMLGYMSDIMEKRKSKQPLDKPSAGSSFKRSRGHFAAALIDECGLKGCMVGAAQISEKHAGFIVNTGGATCDDIVKLADYVTKTVKEKTGITLEKEMIIVK